MAKSEDDWGFGDLLGSLKEASLDAIANHIGLIDQLQHQGAKGGAASSPLDFAFGLAQLHLGTYARLLELHSKSLEGIVERIAGLAVKTAGDEGADEPRDLFITTDGAAEQAQAANPNFETPGTYLTIDNLSSREVLVDFAPSSVVKSDDGDPRGVKLLVKPESFDPQCERGNVKGHLISPGSSRKFQVFARNLGQLGAVTADLSGRVDVVVDGVRQESRPVVIRYGATAGLPERWRDNLTKQRYDQIGLEATVSGSSVGFKVEMLSNQAANERFGRHLVRIWRSTNPKENPCYLCLPRRANGWDALDKKHVARGLTFWTALPIGTEFCMIDVTRPLESDYIVQAAPGSDPAKFPGADTVIKLVRKSPAGGEPDHMLMWIRPDDADPESNLECAIEEYKGNTLYRTIELSKWHQTGAQWIALHRTITAKSGWTTVDIDENRIARNRVTPPYYSSATLADDKWTWNDSYP